MNNENIDENFKQFLNVRSSGGPFCFFTKESESNESSYVLQNFPISTIVKGAPLLPRPVHTYPDLFENASLLSGLGSRLHGDGVFDQQKRNFRKRSPEWIFFKTTFSCSHVDRGKRNFLKTLTSQCRFLTHQSMGLVLGGSREGCLLTCLLSKF